MCLLTSVWCRSARCRTSGSWSCPREGIFHHLARNELVVEEFGWVGELVRLFRSLWRVFTLIRFTSVRLRLFRFFLGFLGFCFATRWLLVVLCGHSFTMFRFRHCFGSFRVFLRRTSGIPTHVTRSRVRSVDRKWPFTSGHDSHFRCICRNFRRILASTSSFLRFVSFSIRVDLVFRLARFNGRVTTRSLLFTHHLLSRLFLIFAIFSRRFIYY